MKSILHSHRISNFQQNQVFHPNPNATTFNGTMTVTTERGTTENVPGFFQFQNNQMSIWVNPGDIENHFGPTTPIQGMIINPELLQGIAVSYPQVYNQVFNKTAVVRTVDSGVALRTVQ